jgi:hypothetical protein
MRDEKKTPQPKTEDLELNRETLADLTEREAERVQGGVGTGGGTDVIQSAHRAGAPYSCVYC